MESCDMGNLESEKTGAKVSLIEIKTREQNSFIVIFCSISENLIHSTLSPTQGRDIRESSDIFAWN